MERFPKSRIRDSSALCSTNYKTSENCEGAHGISVVDWSDVYSGANWTVAAYNCGTSSEYDCERALQLIVPRLQGFYELVQKH
jgi:hypothetical protein